MAHMEDRVHEVSRSVRDAAKERPIYWVSRFETVCVEHSVLLRGVVFLALLLFVVERAHDRVIFADIWGEDGKVFFLQAARSGVSSLRTPMVGSFFTIERGLMLLALYTVPLPWLPQAIAIVSLAVFALVMSRVVTRAYDWLAPLYARIALAFMFCLLPGLAEMMGNLCNLNWILFCWLALLGLKDPETPLTWKDVAMSVLVIVSIGTAVLLVPLFAWRFTRACRRGRPLAKEALHLLALLVLGVVLLVFQDRPPSSAMPSVINLARLWYDHLARLVAFTPWLGDRLTFEVWRLFPGSFYRVGKIAFLAFAAWFAWSYRRDLRAQAVVLLVLGMSFWTVLAALARPYAVTELQQNYSDMFYGGRYSFPMSFAGVLFWMAAAVIVVRMPTRRAALVGTFAVLNVVLSLHRFNIPAYGAERRWLHSVDALEQSLRSGCPRAVLVRQYPDPLEFTYASRRSDCPQAMTVPTDVW